MIKVSVAIGTWNRVDMVRQAIMAALDQTLKPFEIVVFDDASPDNSYEILSKEFENHPIVKVFRQPVNTGGVPNWNAAINACSGDYIAWCSDDDRWFTWHLEKSISFLQTKTQLGLVHSAYCTSFESNEETSVDFDKINEAVFEKVNIESIRSQHPIIVNRENVLEYYLRYYNGPFHPSTWVFTREAWKRVGEFDPQYELADTAWFLKLAESYDIAYLPFYGVLNRRHPNNWSNLMGGTQMQREQYRMVETVLHQMPQGLKKFKLKVLWSLFFQQLMFRLFISRSRGGYIDAALQASKMLREISVLRLVPPKLFSFLELSLAKSAHSLQKTFFKDSDKYSALGKNSPK